MKVKGIDRQGARMRQERREKPRDETAFLGEPGELGRFDVLAV